ncbi:MAG: glycosyltransferase [Mycolicibacterium sp.]|nr:glycosyltransferase [Mycolicibacterium sp.]
MSRAFPDAPIYTMLYEPGTTFPEFRDLDVRVPAINRLTPLRNHHRAALPILPMVAGSMHVDADVVLCSSSGWAHGFRTNGRKLIYCHSPARWLYQADSYLGGQGNTLAKLGLRATSRYLKQWDRRAAMSSDRYLANSTAIRERVLGAYGIDADVVFPPAGLSITQTVQPIQQVENWVGGESPALDSPDGAFYLVVSRLLPYKNVDAIVRAFANSGRRLVVVGRGPQAARLKAMKTSNVMMLSDLSDGELGWLYKNCRAIIAASYEDYGLTPLEAGAWGRPALALRFGGFLDTIHEGISGMYFDEPTSAAIKDAVDRFEMTRFDADKIRDHVKQFSQDAFSEKLHDAVDGLLAPSR